MRAKLEAPVELTKQIVRGYYQGDIEPWLSRLCPKSVWVGAGERTIIGGGAIREHFSQPGQWRTFRIFQEEYYPLPVSTRFAAVVANVTVGRPESESAYITASYTFFYQMIGAEAKIVLTHAGHGFLRSRRSDQEGPLIWVPAYHLYRNLMLDMPETKRLAIPSGGRTFYIHPNIILYIQSKDRRAELFCVDAVVRSDLSIHQMNMLLPDDFCSIHRCYTVNSRYVSAIRRYQVTMVTGETLPVPAEAYNRIKAELDKLISRSSAGLEE